MMKVLIASLILCTYIFAQKQPATVTEFYMAMPTSLNVVKDLSKSEFRDGFFFDQFYSNERNTSRAAIDKFRRSLIKVEDVRNGYLRLEGDWEGWAEIALFKKADGLYLVAISQVQCGPSCVGDLMFLDYRGGTWTNVTSRVFSYGPSSGTGYFDLPRTGTTILLLCGDEGGETCKREETLAEFRWDKAKFVRR